MFVQFRVWDFMIIRYFSPFECIPRDPSMSEKDLNQRDANEVRDCACYLSQKNAASHFPAVSAETSAKRLSLSLCWVKMFISFTFYLLFC